MSVTSGAISNAFGVPALEDPALLEIVIRPFYLAQPAKWVAPNLVALPVSSLLMGILMTQVWSYVEGGHKLPRQRRRRAGAAEDDNDGESVGDLIGGWQSDRWMIRSLVVVELVLGVIAWVFSWMWAWSAFVTHYSTFVTFLSARHTAYFYILLPLQIVPIQAFYSYKAYRLWKSHLAVPIICMAFSLLVWGASWALAIQFLPHSNMLAALTRPVRICLYVQIFGSIGSDAVITLFILVALTGWSHTDALLMRLVWITMETQLLPTILSIVCAIDFAPNYSLAVATPYLNIIGVVWANCFLYSLNARPRIALGGVHFSTTEGDFKRFKRNNVFALKIRKPTADVISHHHSLPSLSISSSSAGAKFEMHGGGRDVAGAPWSKIVEQGSTITADDADDDASRHGSQVALRERV